MNDEHNELKYGITGGSLGAGTGLGLSAYLMNRPGFINVFDKTFKTKNLSMPSKKLAIGQFLGGVGGILGSQLGSALGSDNVIGPYSGGFLGNALAQIGSSKIDKNLIQKIKNPKTRLLAALMNPVVSGIAGTSLGAAAGSKIQEAIDDG